MERNVHRIITLGAVLALVGVLALGASAFAKGPDGGSQAQTHERTQTETQEPTQTQTQEHTQTQTQVHSQADASCTGSCDGSQERNGQYSRNGEAYGVGNGTGPTEGEQFGPGPNCRCLDADHAGICVCAKGSDGGSQAQTQERTQAQTQTRTEAQTQVRSQPDVSCTGSCDGNQERGGQYSRNGKVYGPGDGTSPIGGGQFGPGPNGKCLDVDSDGICDCRE